jgi:iron complex outermembrane recepter protein
MVTIKRMIFTIICLLVFYPIMGIASETDTGAIKLEEIIITASKISQLENNVTQKIDVIDRKDIEETITGNHNMAELLTDQPGVFVSVLSRNDANWGSVSGLSQKYNTYMLDGLPIDAFTETQSLSTRSFEQIEHQSGPASVLYPNYLSMDFSGNQSPLAGTTNFILKEKVEKELSEIGAYYGTYKTRGLSYYHQQASGNVHFFFGTDFEASDYTNYGTKGSWLNMIDNPEYDKTKIYLRTTIFVNGKDDHKLSFFVNRAGHKGDAGRPNRGYDHEYWTINSSYAVQLNDNLNANLKVGYRDYDRSWEEDNSPANFSLASKNGVKQTIIPADLYFTRKDGKNGITTFGMDYQSDSYQTYSLAAVKTIGNDADARQYGLYAQEEMALNSLILRAGGRYANTKHDIYKLSGAEPGSSGQSWNKFLWSVGARYNVNDSFAVYTNAGSSFVAPSLKSVGGTISLADKGVEGVNGQLPNPDLKPEEGTGYDLGLDIKAPSSVTFNLRGFYNIVSDQIVDVVVSNNPSQTQSINAGDRTKSYGFELSFKQKPLSWLEWFANYTYTKSRIESSTDMDQDGAEIPFVPAHMGNIGVQMDLPQDIEASISLHMAGSIYDGSSLSGRTKFDSYETLNSHIQKCLIKSDSYRLNAYIDLYNITNNKFEMPWQFQDPGLSATVGIKMSF